MEIRPLLEQRQPVDIYAKRITRNEAPENSRGEFVLYWAQSARRLTRNIALNYAIDKANEAGLPVVVYESIRPDYQYANDRLHSFVLEGVGANIADVKRRGLRYLFFLPRTRDEARGVMKQLASRARFVITDEFPTSVVREQTRRFMQSSPVAAISVDGNGILPMRAFDKEQYSAKVLRDRARRLIPEHWMPVVDVEPRFRFEGETGIDPYDGTDPHAAARACEIDHGVAPVAIKGGREAGLLRMRAMQGRASGLSPYLHFGHLGIHEVIEHVLQSTIAEEEVEGFLEQAIIRRELSFNMCFFRDDFDSMSALPDWAQRTLDKHRDDRRSPQYSLEDLDAGRTHDDVWNLAQRQLLESGTMHNYLRMLWGKKIIEWSATPEDALHAMIHFFNRYSLDGRDPNTYAGALWCLGKHDRPWFPERPIFGTIRYMSSESTRKKLKLVL